MDEIWDFLMTARGIGVILLFVVLFGAFFTALVNPLENGIRMLVYIIIMVAAILWGTGLIWNWLEG